MKRLFILLGFTLLYSFIAYGADPALSCLTNNKDLSIGQTLEQVTNACGEPDSTNKQTKITQQPQQISEWYYLFQFTSEQDANGKPIYILAKLQTDFYDHHVQSVHVYISSKDPKVEDALKLLGYVIEQGATEDRIKTIFGEPMKVSQKTINKEIKTSVVDKIIYIDTNSKQQQTLNFNEQGLASGQVEASKAQPSETTTN